jgi:hypothetical protein
MSDRAIIVQVKSREDVRAHFIFRLQERYGILLSDQEYDHLLRENDFVPKFRKTNNSLGTVTIKEAYVWVLFDYGHGMFTTALPSSVNDSFYEMARVCFNRPVRHVAFMILEDVLGEIKRARMDFDNNKDAALYFFENFNYACVLMDYFKHGINERLMIKVMHTIKNILNSEHGALKLGVVKK